VGSTGGLGGGSTGSEIGVGDSDRTKESGGMT
jgi:hypothetical protein